MNGEKKKKRTVTCIDDLYLFSLNFVKWFLLHLNSFLIFFFLLRASIFNFDCNCNEYLNASLEIERVIWFLPYICRDWHANAYEQQLIRNRTRIVKGRNLTTFCQYNQVEQSNNCNTPLANSIDFMLDLHQLIANFVLNHSESIANPVH